MNTTSNPAPSLHLPTEDVHMSSDVESSVAGTEAAAEAPVGNPMIVGLPGFVVGSVALGLQLIGYVSAGAGAAPLPIIFGSSAIATLITTVWAARLGQNAVAGVFGVFTGFWTSYAVLGMGLTHGWMAVPAKDVAHTQAIFVLSWLIVIAILTLGALRLPSSFAIILALVDLTLVLQLVGILNANTTAFKLSGFCALTFAAIGAYLFYDAMNQAAGGKPLPIGAPLVKA
jgi:succinate-acetate transporter protein